MSEKIARTFSVLNRTRELRNTLITKQERPVFVIDVPGQPEQQFLKYEMARRYANKWARPLAQKEYQTLLEHMVTTVPSFQFKLRRKIVRMPQGSWSQRNQPGTITEVEHMVRLCRVVSRTNLKYIANKFPKSPYMTYQRGSKGRQLDTQIPVKSIFVIINGIVIGDVGRDNKSWYGYIPLETPTMSSLTEAIDKINESDFLAHQSGVQNLSSVQRLDPANLYDGRHYKIEATAEPLIKLWMAKQAVGVYDPVATVPVVSTAPGSDAESTSLVQGASTV